MLPLCPLVILWEENGPNSMMKFQIPILRVHKHKQSALYSLQTYGSFHFNVLLETIQL